MTTSEQVAADVVLRDGVLAVSGALTFATVPELWERSSAWVSRTDGPLTIDLTAVTRADSAGLGLLVEWLRQAASAGRRLRFANIPTQVQSLARVNGLSSALDLPA
jgi:phospholipid transport system transporter-binding protein